MLLLVFLVVAAAALCIAFGLGACGDMGRGQSHIVWAIAAGRACAAGVDRHLAGDTQLPFPIEPTARPLV